MDKTSAASLLLRTSQISTPTLTPLQTQVDDVTSSFIAHATDWKSMVAMTAGGVAYRLGRMGLLGCSGGGISRIASLATGLSSEITAFELTHRVLRSGTDANANLWRWSGSGGLREGLLSSLITFGTLRGAGHLARSENFVVQHLLQDSAMVLGHNVSGALGIGSRPSGSFVEQFLHAEATLWQMQAGMSLVHGMTPTLSALERSLDLSLHAVERGQGRYGHTTWGNGLEAGVTEAEGPVGLSVLWMSGKPVEKGGEGTPPLKGSSFGSGEMPRAGSSERLSEPEALWVDESSRAVAEASADSYVTINEQGFILYVNPALHELLGYEKTDLVGRPLTVLIPPSFRRSHETGLRRYLQTGVRSFDHRKGMDLPVLHRDGSWVPVHLSFEEQVRGERRYFTGIMYRTANDVDETGAFRPAERTPLPLSARAFEYSSPHELNRVLRDDPAPILQRLAQGDLYLKLTDEISPNSTETYILAFCTALNARIRNHTITATRIWVEFNERGQSQRRVELVFRNGRFVRASEPPAGSDSSPLLSKGSREQSFIGLRTEGAGQRGSGPVAHLSRLQSELSQATVGFKGKIEVDGDIELHIPSGLQREFLEQNAAEVLRRFNNLVWGYHLRSGRKVSLIFEIEGGPLRIDLEKAEVGFKVNG